MIRNFEFASILAGVFAVTSTTGAWAENRTYDGNGNNLVHSTWGAAGTQLTRLSPVEYGDLVLSPAGGSRPNPREISNIAIAQTVMLPNAHQMTDWVFQWGQFVDHDIDLTGAASPVESFNISIPAGDPIFDPANTGTQIMPFQRSHYDPATGVGLGNPRQQINEISSYLDGSMVYGSDAARATALRALSGGRLLTSPGNLLPLNTLGLPNGAGGGSPTDFYVAGDVRANEQIGLTAIHTLMMREHNRLAGDIEAANPLWSDEEIYQRARKLVGAEIQSITYHEFLPTLLGPTAPSANAAYDANIDASIANEFSTALYRVGHTMLSPRLMRMDNDGTPAPGGHVALRDAFFQPQNLAGASELEYFLKGLASDQQQEVDMHVVDEVRNFLFGEPLVGGFDLPTLNIQRGRDHGLADYNSVRTAYGLPAAATFADITSDAAIQSALASLYGSVADVDVWVGAIAEDHVPGAAVGELILTGLRDQFTRLRDGDRFWYQNDEALSSDDVAWLDSIRLSDVIRLNTSITNIQSNVFIMAVPEPSSMLLAMGMMLATLVARRARRTAC
jgi:hypothetical protein